VKYVPILVLDFGSQYTQLISKRLRKSGFYSEIVPYNEPIEDIKARDPKGIILSGGPASVYANDAYKVDKAIFDLGLPILGICYGMQTIAHYLGGSVIPADHHEYGKAKLRIKDSSCKIFDGITNDEIVWMSHGDKVESLPIGFKVIGTSENSPYAAIANEEKKIYAFQYHPEVTHSVDGGKMLVNFAKHICNCEKNWNMGNFAKEQIQKIKNQVGDLLKNFTIFDIYRGEGIEKGRKSLSFSLILQSFSSTLTSEESEQIMQKVITELKEKYNAHLR